MLMRRSERRGGHELNRHGKHANGQTYTHHANWCLKAKTGIGEQHGKADRLPREAENRKVRASDRAHRRLSIEN